MDAFELSDLERQRVEAGKLHLEFLRAPALSLGLYVLPAGGVEVQTGYIGNRSDRQHG